MHAYLIQHIDALITTAIGIFITAYSLRDHKRLATNHSRMAQALRVLGPLIILTGFAELLVGSRAAYSWQRQFTGDRRASVEFPCPTATDTVNHSEQGVPIRRVTIACDVPNRDIDLRLTYDEIPAEAAKSVTQSEAQRIDAIRSYFLQHGFAIVSDIADRHGDIPGYRILVEQRNGKMSCLLRLAMTPSALYRVAATFPSDSPDDPVVKRFVESFKMQ